MLAFFSLCFSILFAVVYVKTFKEIGRPSGFLDWFWCAVSAVGTASTMIVALRVLFS